MNSNYSVTLTSNAAAAVAVVQVAGPEAWTAIKYSWKSASDFANLPLNRICFGRWRSAASSDSPDAGEDVVVCRVADEVFEIHCHGGSAAQANIRADLSRAGVVAIGTTELHSDRGDSITQAAFADLAKATTVNSAAVLLAQANGALTRQLEEICESILTKPEAIVRDQLQELIHRSRVGLWLLHPPRVGIVGPPNAGKSTLLNCLLGWDRAIVHSSPGTTRDTLSETISLGGWPITMVDSAGLRTTDELIEKEGIEKSRLLLQETDVLLLLVDLASGWTAEHQLVHSQFAEKTLVVGTKLDQKTAAHHDIADNSPSYDVNISAKTGEGIAALVDTLLLSLGYPSDNLQIARPFRKTQVDALNRALTLIHKPEDFRQTIRSLISDQATSQPSSSNL